MLRYSRTCLRRQGLSNQLACIQAVSNPELLTYDPIPQIWRIQYADHQGIEWSVSLTHCLSWPAGKLFHKDPSRARTQPFLANPPHAHVVTYCARINAVYIAENEEAWPRSVLTGREASMEPELRWNWDNGGLEYVTDHWMCVSINFAEI